MTTNTIEVIISGREYTLRTEDDPSYVRDLARMVDERLENLASASKTVDSGRLAVLAALNLADEYCRLKKEYTSRIQELEQEQARLLGLVDAALSEEELPSLPDL